MEHTKKLLAELAGNLRWTWHGDFDPIFREIDLDLWRRCNHNPTLFLAEVQSAKIEACIASPHYRVRLERACRAQREYLESARHWGAYNAPALKARPVAYFCAEFGLHESIPIYSGGLGVLAGDHLKSASDLGVAAWGVGILYREGYFLQHVNEQGEQSEEYVTTDLRQIAIEQIPDPSGQPLELRFPVNSESMHLHLWRAMVGRTPLLLLDGALEPSLHEESPFTRRLYGGDAKTRLLQEIMLGVGGYRALRALGVRPGVIHLNEGHSAFAVLEAIADHMEEEGTSFREAADCVSRQVVFTTHTPVEAGHDRFPSHLIEEHLGVLRRRLGLSHEQLMGLGRIHPNDPNEQFCMTVLALKLANHANAVSALHGHVTRRMWKGLWSSRQVDEIPIGHITNGVHVPSWIAPEVSHFFDRQLGEEWVTKLCRPELWAKILDADTFELWDIKCGLKRKLLEFLDRRLAKHEAHGGRESPGGGLIPEALTIGFARRFVEYKRSMLIFSDPERLTRILTNPARPVQIIFAGKAHPYDNVGKGILRKVHEYSHDPRFAGRILFLENHDMNVSRHLVQGCDLWLNLPRRPLEACGTSGMKAVFNGTLNLSVLDGWWAEAYSGSNGYAVGEGLTHVSPVVQDKRDAENFYQALETQVIPDFFTRTPEDVPTRWIQRIQQALASLAWRYNSDRMLIDYTRNYYLPASGATTSILPPELG